MPAFRLSGCHTHTLPTLLYSRTTIHTNIDFRVKAEVRRDTYISKHTSNIDIVGLLQNTRSLVNQPTVRLLLKYGYQPVHVHVQCITITIMHFDYMLRAGVYPSMHLAKDSDPSWTGALVHL